MHRNANWLRVCTLLLPIDWIFTGRSASSSKQTEIHMWQSKGYLLNWLLWILKIVLWCHVFMLLKGAGGQPFSNETEIFLWSWITHINVLKNINVIWVFHIKAKFYRSGYSFQWPRVNCCKTLPQKEKLQQPRNPETIGIISSDLQTAVPIVVKWQHTKDYTLCSLAGGCYAPLNTSAFY